MKVGDKLLIFKIPRKELSCSNPYLFTTRWCKPFLYFKLRLLNLTELIVLNDFGLQRYMDEKIRVCGNGKYSIPLTMLGERKSEKNDLVLIMIFYLN